MIMILWIIFSSNDMFTKPILFDDTDGDNDDELKFRGDGDCDDVGDPLTNDVRIDVGDGYDSS